jgi:hypothetical protein
LPSPARSEPHPVVPTTTRPTPHLRATSAQRTATANPDALAGATTASDSGMAGLPTRQCGNRARAPTRMPARGFGGAGDTPSGGTRPSTSDCPRGAPRMPLRTRRSAWTGARPPAAYRGERCPSARRSVRNTTRDGGPRASPDRGPRAPCARLEWAAVREASDARDAQHAQAEAAVGCQGPHAVDRLGGWRGAVAAAATLGGGARPGPSTAGHGDVFSGLRGGDHEARRYA